MVDATTTEGYKWQDLAMSTRLKGHQANLTSGQINLNTITQRERVWSVFVGRGGFLKYESKIK